MILLHQKINLGEKKQRKLKNLFFVIILTLFFVIILTLFFQSGAIARPIISGISTNKINIDSNFTGQEILLFGAKGDVGDIVIIVRGPKKNYIINKKAEVLGIWHNQKRIQFNDVYSYYSFFSTSNDLKNQRLLKILQIGQQNINLQTKEKEKKADEINFKVQLLKKMGQDKLYTKNSDHIEFLDESLFKVMLTFPKNIARGEYLVEIYLLDEGNLTAFQALPIYVNQVGFSAKINDMAHYNSLFYAIISLLLAITAGFIANIIFSKLFK